MGPQTIRTYLPATNLQPTQPSRKYIQSIKTENKALLEPIPLSQQLALPHHPVTKPHHLLEQQGNNHLTLTPPRTTTPSFPRIQLRKQFPSCISCSLNHVHLFVATSKQEKWKQQKTAPLQLCKSSSNANSELPLPLKIIVKSPTLQKQVANHLPRYQQTSQQIDTRQHNGPESSWQDTIIYQRAYYGHKNSIQNNNTSLRHFISQNHRHRPYSFLPIPILLILNTTKTTQTII